MNDRYLYRAKRIDDGEWAEGSLLIDTCGCFICDDNCINNRKSKNGHYGYEIMEIRAFEIDPSTICQCTGLKDKNGKLIWENDIVICKEYVGGNHVEYCIENGYVEILYGAFGLHRKSGYYRPFKDWLESYEYEVIGNIFDNPELLE